MHPVIEWKNGAVLMLEQRLLPREERYVELRDAAAVAEGIRAMIVRGAPAIGIAAAYGVCVGLRDAPAGAEQRSSTGWKKWSPTWPPAARRP